jgi:WD40 repeat protein
LSDTVIQTSLVETRGVSHALDAHVVAAVFDRAHGRAAFALGDGTLRIARLGGTEDWARVEAHDGAVLALAADTRPGGFISGGDDGRFVRVDESGGVHELAAFGGKWVEQAASFSDGKTGVLTCAAGKFVHLFSADGAKLKALEHPSTVTGLAFDAKGKRLAASHYNGASLWFVGSSAATPRRLEWKGSHTGVAIHPAADAVVTAMQENALHGWRLPDAHDMRMSGYPSKPESLGFTRGGKYLASSGADAIVLWPFFGGGPMGKPPLELAQMTTVCTRVACHPADDIVAAGYADGSVVLAEITGGRVLRVAPPGHGAISALAWSGDGAWLGFGTEQGFAALIDLSKREPAR